MVSILHILQQIPKFVRFINKYKQFINEDIKNKITYHLSRLIKFSYENDNIRIAPCSFKKIIGEKDSLWSELEHQDSQEFYTFLITQLEEECGKITDLLPIKYNDNDDNIVLKILAHKHIHTSEKKDYSPIKDLFMGYFISNIECSFCSTLSPSFESFLTIPLSIPINKKDKDQKFTLNECLDLFVKNERLDKDNKLTCDICGIKNRSLKKIQLWKAPEILVFQLKRFVTNNYGIATSKITNQVTYPINDFDISDYFHPDSPFKNNTKYNLIGVNIHMELGFNSIHAGHYISIVKSYYNNKWGLFDDANEVIISDNDEHVQNKNAYLLFYCRNN
jgi:ubiquitin C-terminal hydrolase